MINVSGLHSNTRQKVISANSEFNSLMSEDIPIASTLPSISVQAERYIDLILEENSTNTILPGCSLLNYGIGIKVIMAQENLLLMTNPSFEEMMAHHDLVPVSNAEEGDFFNFASPHLDRIQNEISILQQANTGKAWLWAKAVNDYKELMQQIELKQHQLSEIIALQQELQGNWQIWLNRRDELILELNITLIDFQIDYHF